MAKYAVTFGQITPLFLVDCGTCDVDPWRLEHVKTKTEAIRHIRRMGWKQTKKHGWRCPECVAGIDDAGDGHFDE